MEHLAKMTATIEVNASGELSIPKELLPDATPQARYSASTEGGMIVIKPEVIRNGYWASTTPSQRAADFRKFVDENKVVGVGLPDCALSRENIYD